MLFSWMVFPPILLYYGRFKENIFGKHWYLVHKYTVTLMMLFVVTGLILANRYRIDTLGRLKGIMRSRHGLPDPSPRLLVRTTRSRVLSTAEIFRSWRRCDDDTEPEEDSLDVDA